MGLLFYNTVGYYLLLLREQSRASVAVAAVGAAPNEEPNFVILRIPVSLYLHTENTEFERTDTDFLLEGKAYKMLKQRIRNDSLEIYCVANPQQDKITAQITDFIRQNLCNDSATSDKNAATKVLKYFLKDYISNNNTFYICHFPSFLPKKRRLFLDANKNELTSPFLSVSSPPPEA